MLKDPHTSSWSPLKAYVAWFTCTLFFAYQYILRVVPSVMVEELRNNYHLTAEQFATLGAYYLYAYSLLQIPLGALVDFLGIRRIILGSIGLCMGGTVLFAHNTSFSTIQLSRILMGTGSATAFMCSLKIAADYFPTGKRGLLMGLTLSIGTLSTLTTGKPLVFLLETMGWRDTLSLYSLLGIPLLFLSVFFLPTAHQKTSRTVKKACTTFVQSVTTILQNRMIMLYTLLAIGLYTPLSALADLWGTAFLMQKYGFARANAAQTSMMMYLGLALGSLILPWLFEKYNCLNRGIQLCGFTVLSIMSLILYAPPMGITLATTLLLSLGFFCGGEMLCFTGAIAHTTAQTSGLTLGIVNTLNMLGGAFLQNIIGFGLDWQWSGLMNDQHIRLYTTQEFVFSLSVLLVVIALCVLLSFALRKQPKRST